MTQEHQLTSLELSPNLADLMLKMNAFVSIKDAEILTTLDKTTQYRLRVKGRFPPLVTLVNQGRRKCYRINDLLAWIENPDAYHCPRQNA